MSDNFDPKDSYSASQALKVQELAISGLDYQMYSTVAGTPIMDPYLATAGTFAVLGATTVTNTGSSVLTGNLGLNPGSSITGFPPGTVSGATDVDNTAAMNAQASALSAYTLLASHSSTTIASALDGQTLTPGYYSFSSGAATLAASANGTLTLNGAGTYVIKTASTLGTGAGGTPTVALTGGATAANVYWIVGSSATLNASGTGTMQGNVIANSSITVEGGTVNGSLIALTGAVTISAATAITAVSTGTPTLNISVRVLEPVKEVYNAYFKVDASNSMYNFNQANIAIVDSNGALSGFNFSTGQWVSDQGVIELLGLPETAFNANDCCVVQYKTQADLDTFPERD